MIEIIIRNYLDQELDAPVYLEYPENEEIPKRHVMIEKTGSGKEDHIESATLAIQSNGASLWETIQLNAAVKETMEASAALPQIGSVDLNGDYNFTDTQKKGYRYQAVYHITYYRQEV